MKHWVKPGEDFRRLCTTYQRSSWRWECQGTYREPKEREPFQLWRDGQDEPSSFMADWVSTIKGLRAAGKTFDRVRMCTEPPTEYLRWMLSFTHINVEAGEDIRWILEGRARELGMVTHDFYLFDDTRVAIMQFDENGVSGAEVTDEPEVVAEHRRWRDLVWPVAIPHKEFEYSP